MVLRQGPQVIVGNDLQVVAAWGFVRLFVEDRRIAVVDGGPGLVHGGLGFGGAGVQHVLVPDEPALGVVLCLLLEAGDPVRLRWEVGRAEAERHLALDLVTAGNQYESGTLRQVLIAQGDKAQHACVVHHRRRSPTRGDVGDDTLQLELGRCRHLADDLGVGRDVDVDRFAEIEEIERCSLSEQVTGLHDRDDPITRPSSSTYASIVNVASIPLASDSASNWSIWSSGTPESRRTSAKSASPDTCMTSTPRISVRPKSSVSTSVSSWSSIALGSTPVGRDGIVLEVTIEFDA